MKYKTLILVFVFFVCSFFIIGNKKEKETKEEKTNNEVRAVYFSYIEFNSYIKDKTTKESKENIKEVLNNIKDFGFNTVILHTRPFADSIYKSKYFPISSTILNNQNTIPEYDVLKFFIEESHKRDLKIEAWINPFRISNTENIENLPVDSPYYKFIKTNDAKMIKGKGIYLNPASSAVQELIINGIIEIIEKYNIDGIHFDDYFYPDKTIDLNTYEEYKKENKEISIEEYRLNNISNLIKNVYTNIKKINKNITFGIAPEGNIENNYNNSYLDVKKILSEDGYIDYIMPQIYYGFENQVKPFIKTLNEWNNLIKNKNIKLIPALGLYKSGTIDKYAGNGKNEWLEHDDIIKREIQESRKKEKYQGISIFRYDYIFSNTKNNNFILIERKNIKELFK